MRNSDVWQVLSADNFPFHQAFFKVKNTLSLTSPSAPVSHLILPQMLQMLPRGKVEEAYNSWSSEQRVLEKATAVITGIKA